MGTYYAIAELFGSCPSSDKWYSEASLDNAKKEAVKRVNDGEGPMTIIKITTERVGMTSVAFVEDKKETDG